MIKINTESKINIISGILANNIDLVKEVFNISENLCSVPINKDNVIADLLNNIEYIFNKLDIKSKFQGSSNKDLINAITKILGSIVINMDKHVLIINPENGLHYKVLVYLWVVIKKFANKYNCKLFIITQSYEFLEIVIGRCTNNDIEIEEDTELTNLSYFRLEFTNDKDGIEFTRMNYDELKIAIEHQWEVR